MKVSNRPTAGPRNRAAERESCCWPDCGLKRHDESDAPPLCSNHLIECAVYMAERMKLFLLDPDGGRKETVSASQPLDGEVVYYVRMGDHIKIGTTTNLAKRLSQLYVSHDPSALLGVEAGGRQVEQDRHREFRTERVHANRELFNPSPRLLEHIASLT